MAPDPALQKNLSAVLDRDRTVTSRDEPKGKYTSYWESNETEEKINTGSSTGKNIDKSQ